MVAGLGGVGAYAAEQLCRAGIGEMTIIDGDVVELTNKNRQLPALDCNLGKAKAEIMAGRFRNINPEIKLHVINDFIRDDRMIEVAIAAVEAVYDWKKFLRENFGKEFPEDKES